MSWLLAGLAGLLLLAVPASIAKASLVGGLVVLAILAALALATVTLVARQRRRPRPTRRYVQIAVVTVIYAGVVVLIHTT